MSFRRSLSVALALALVGSAALAGSQGGRVHPGWPTHGGNSSHTGIGAVSAQPLNRIVWSAPLDLNPQYNGDVLYAHYGSPVVSDKNVVIMPVKTGATGGFRIEARRGANGLLLWQEDSDYVTPSHNWFPTFGPTLVDNVAAWPKKAGLVQFRDTADSEDYSRVVCFFGMANYLANPAAYDAAVRISSPLVTGPNNSIYFTYRVEGATPLGLKGGIAVIPEEGNPRYVEGATVAGAGFERPKLNGAPAATKGAVYAVFKRAGSNQGVLVGLNAKTLAPLYKTRLVDPKNGDDAYVDDDGTACPTVGPDGDVYYGVLESPFPSHHYRGWLLHFDKTLVQRKTPGSFGWDDSPSIIPRSMVPGYTGTSDYLVMTKYNNYAGQGDGVNKLAVLDPNDVQVDPYSGVQTMREVLTKVGPTPDADHTANFPNAVREWCINTAAVDVANKSVIVNNEDGILYRWNLETNALDQSFRLNSGIGQAYTPTLLSATGLVLSVSNARLYVVGQ